MTKAMTGQPPVGKLTLPKATVLQRLSRLFFEDKVLLEPAALFEEPFEPAEGLAVLARGGAGRLYLLEQLRGFKGEGLPEMVSAADLSAWLERSGPETLDPRYLRLDHPEGVMARFNRWFYVGHGEGAFSEGQVPTEPAKDPRLIRAEAALVARLARRGGTGRPKVLKLGAGCDVEPVRLLFQELGQLAEGCQVVFSDFSPPLMAEARRRAEADPLLSGLLRDGRLKLRVLDASRPELAEGGFTLIQSSYLYDSMPQRELARLGDRWYEFKVRPQLEPRPELEAFHRRLLSDDLEGLRQEPTESFRHLDWQVVLDPLPPEEVPHRALLEDIYAEAEVQEVAVPLPDALTAGFEVLLPLLVPGGALQTFDLGAAVEQGSCLDPRAVFRGLSRRGGAVFMPQNFALARRIFAERGLQASHLSKDNYLEETLGEEVICTEPLRAARGNPSLLQEMLGRDFVARFWDCLEGAGSTVLMRFRKEDFLTRSEAEDVAARLVNLGLDGRGFVEGLFALRLRLRLREGVFDQFRVEAPE